jgi:hypothetical protein
VGKLDASVSCVSPCSKFFLREEKSYERLREKCKEILFGYGII